MEPAELTLDNVVQALYEINKFIEIRRNAKKDNNYINHDNFSAAKRREFKLYELKEKGLNKLISENSGEIEGGERIQRILNYKTDMLLLRLGTYAFHIPLRQDSITVYTALSLDATIHAEKASDNTIGFCKNIDLLERFLAQESESNIAN